MLELNEKSSGKETCTLPLARAREKLIELYYTSGDTKLKKSDFDGAIRDFSQAVALDPQNAWILGPSQHSQGEKRRF